MVETSQKTYKVTSKLLNVRCGLVKKLMRKRKICSKFFGLVCSSFAWENSGVPSFYNEDAQQ